MNQQDRHKKRFAFIPVFIIAGIFALAAVVRFLWNKILPEAVGANPISYWQALGLFVLCKILFGGFRGRPDRNKQWGGWQKFNRGGGPGSQFGNLRGKWMSMSDEERQRFKQEMKRRCGRPPGARPPENI
ncbi:hypothetical protein [Dyadobacter luticola]|nr:hypothetical protein [Dyadobacter luticola]